MNPSQDANARHAARQPTPQPRSKPGATPEPVAADVREVMIAEAAYYIAEHRGFTPGAELDDWLEAESGIDRSLGAIAAEGGEEGEPDGARAAN